MDFSAPQILMVLVIALLVFGPKRLPELGRQVGRGLREMRRHMTDVTQDFTSVKDEVQDVGRATTAATAETTVDTTPTAEVDDDDLLEGVVVDGSTPPVRREGA